MLTTNEPYCVQNRKVEPLRVACISHAGPYQELGPVYGRLFAWMEQKQVKANGFIREIGYDNPMLTPPEKCRQEICVPVSDGIQSEPGIEIKTLPQSDVISIVYRGSLDFQSMGPAYKALMQWAGANGKRTEYSIVTYYTSPHNREKAEVEIAMVVA